MYFGMKIKRNIIQNEMILEIVVNDEVVVAIAVGGVAAADRCAI